MFLIYPSYLQSPVPILTALVIYCLALIFWSITISLSSAANGLSQIASFLLLISVINLIHRVMKQQNIAYCIIIMLWTCYLVAVTFGISPDSNC